MPTLDPRIDAYIAASPAFAQPILNHIRAVIHAACPAVEEDMKWSRPHFQYKGMLCQMSAFKAHCALGFWKGKLLFPDSPQEGMGHFGRITSIADLPPQKALAAIIKQAMKLNDEGEKAPARARPAVRELIVPEPMQAALAGNAAARATFDKGSASFKREYVDWVAGAKTEATRTRRLEQAIAWLAEGKARNWKYEKC
jgi:uncharacterized protein YdeI (YjbR/CyaY-like superfamily)